MATSGQNILFKYGLKSNFSSVSPKDENTVYFVQDAQDSTTGDLWVGNKQFSGLEITTTGSGKYIVGVSKSGRTLTFTLGDIASGDLSSILANYVQSVTAKTVANGGGAIEVDNTDPQNPIVGLKLDNSGNVTLSQGADGLKANVTYPTAGLVGINGNDQFLGESGGFIESNITATYESGTVYFWGNDTVSPAFSVDLSNIVEDTAPNALKDGMLETVTYENHQMTFVFNTWDNDGDPETTPTPTHATFTVNISDLADVYTGANGITVSASNIVSINNMVTSGAVIQEPTVTLAFGETTTATIAQFNTPGLITGTTTVDIQMPALPTGTVGGADKIVSYVSYGAGGLTGTATYDIVNTFPSTTANMSNEVPTALAVETEITNAIQNASIKWETFDPTSTPSV